MTSKLNIISNLLMFLKNITGGIRARMSRSIDNLFLGKFCSREEVGSINLFKRSSWRSEYT
jgi:hypothetical protein